jgi:hypothetical protein
VKITADQIISWRPCYRYPDDRVRALVPGLGLTPLEIAALPIPPEDRVWVLLRPEVLGEHGFQVALDRIVTRAVTNHALHCGVPEVELWAQRWLDGTDRTGAAACSAASAAWTEEQEAAARAAAWAAAEVARAAAWAAEAVAWAARSADAAARAAAAKATWAAERILQLCDIVHILEGRP